jgi:Ca2+:H+ antiporter
LVAISHGGAIVLLIIFACYLGFFYYTHSELTSRKHTIESLVEPTTYIVASVGSKEQLLQLRKASLNRRGDSLHWIVHLFILISSASLLVLSSIFMLEAIDSPSKEIGFSKSFVGLVVVPIIIGAAEHVATAIRAHKNRRDEIEWIIEVAIISSIRTSLFVLPLAVLLGWILGVPGISLFFDGFQVTMLTLAILLVNYIVHAGIAHW